MYPVSAVEQKVSTSTPATMRADLELPIPIMTMPTAIISTVGTSTASMSTSWARRSWTMAGGNRTRQLCLLFPPARPSASGPQEDDRWLRGRQVVRDERGDLLAADRRALVSSSGSLGHRSFRQEGPLD